MNALMLELIPLIREGYCCSQLLVLLVLQQQGVEIPGWSGPLAGFVTEWGKAAVRAGF